MTEQRTYHIYLNDRCLFKNLDADEFDVVWGRLYHSYWDGLTLLSVQKKKQQTLFYQRLATDGID